MTHNLDLIAVLEEVLNPYLLNRMEAAGLTTVELPVRYTYTAATSDDCGECEWRFENAGEQALEAICERFGRYVHPETGKEIIAAVDEYVAKLDLADEIAEDATIAKESHEADWRYECGRDRRMGL